MLNNLINEYKFNGRFVVQNDFASVCSHIMGYTFAQRCFQLVLVRKVVRTTFFRSFRRLFGCSEDRSPADALLLDHQAFAINRLDRCLCFL